MSEAKSWRAIIIAAQGHYLIGGKKVYITHRFEKKHHIEAVADAMVRTNQANGRMVDRVIIKPSKLEPEILGIQLEAVH